MAIRFLQKTNDVVSPDIVRDADDNYLPGICESSKAHFLITGEQDLLVFR